MGAWRCWAQEELRAWTEELHEDDLPHEFTCLLLQEAKDETCIQVYELSTNIAGMEDDLFGEFFDALRSGWDQDDTVALGGLGWLRLRFNELLQQGDLVFL